LCGYYFITVFQQDRELLLEQTKVQRPEHKCQYLTKDLRMSVTNDYIHLIVG